MKFLKQQYIFSFEIVMPFTYKTFQSIFADYELMIADSDPVPTKIENSTIKILIIPSLRNNSYFGSGF